jgi:predicted nucleotidyltransferase component of viral defense system
MKDHLITLVRSPDAVTHRRNIAREYLQARILAALQRAGAMIPLAFHGGTALRFLYGIPRWSEDLDFALEQAPESYDFRSYLAAIAVELGREGYRVECKVSDRRVVHSAFVRFPGLPYELGLSARRDEIIAVKIEIDTRPPRGARVETTVVRRHVIMHLQHHDRESLLAGKLHAVLQRPYVKGRDIFDLIWYLSDPAWPAPNLVMLNNALRQTGYRGRPVTSASWRKVVEGRIRTVDFRKIESDVAPFLDPSVDPRMLSADTLLRVLR